MKEYPSVPKELRNDVYVWAYQKLDGSNIRAEWNSKRGFYKFGSRHQLIDINSKPLGKAIPLIKDKYEQDLAKIFKEQGWRDALCFFEFFGKNSFAGQHLDNEEQMVILFDVNPLRKGILEPKEFLKLFYHLDIPKVLFEGYITAEFVDQVKNSSLPDMPLEGVVCKGEHEGKSKTPIMFKIKSRAWLDKLKEKCSGNENLFKELE